MFISPIINNQWILSTDMGIRFISIHIAIMDVHPQFQTQSLEQLQTIVAPIRWSFCGSMARLDAAINGHFRYTLVE